ncbi:hypothetical protein [Botrimarina sp.]|uniref:hypothetical protein n=1 Tax=Botrimarina sp. TaxID=2795802 RepID=UPI0032EBBAEC
MQTDFVMAYGIGPSMEDRLSQWKQAGYVLHLMTGVSWGAYQDYLEGAFDGRNHWDEAQVAADGSQILHGATKPYMVPSVAFSQYLEGGVKRAIDHGVVGVHLEEPEFWARAGFSEAFKREWQIYYNEPWQRPDSSVDAQYRASKLKYYLYRRTLDRLCSSMKEYALVRHNRPVRFYVPTHSLLNYTQWRIVSPESALIDLPGVDGYIAQVWTGTARTPNTYAGRTAERTLETAYLEYGIMQELTRGTGRRMWFLHDPIEDNPRHDWGDYRANYIRTLVASLLHHDVWRYEVSPWPKRVFQERYPANSPDATRIGGDYATTLAVVFNQLRDMRQPSVDYGGGTQPIGVFLADSAMFQRADPAFSEGLADSPDDDSRQTRDEIHSLSSFYGLTLPLIKHGVPVRPVQLDNVLRVPGYLDDYRVLVLSYEFMKPLQPGVHLALARWVEAGGTLIYVGADTDPFHAVREWWNQSGRSYSSPSQHLFECLGMPLAPDAGEFECRKGRAIVRRKHPSYYSRSETNAEEFRRVVRGAVESGGGDWEERNYLRLRRGPYVIAAVLDEAVSNDPLVMRGAFLDLLDPHLSVCREVTVRPGEQAWLLDLQAVSSKDPLLLAAAGRVEAWNCDGRRLTYQISTPEGIRASTRIRLSSAPARITVDGSPCQDVQWDEASRTVLLRHDGRPAGVEVSVELQPSS